ncbi:ABC transporter ATP-binding protein [Belliella kenyensis]|uniref:ABC transporter ATP-binding protein n=1 Tax=Belliella kenyensis TaxID=1472724 RepID=A0ABV8EI01_9BACT|nr:ABC transporter ATP-binding protein [Belliella kenyensis]MCH7400957.1 ABC transporter ATP-binding protein [Belliella kenyensis]MDN3603955.1 ABC transporter ATP-binding protein [Belliella kenyensis]
MEDRNIVLKASSLKLGYKRKGVDVVIADRLELELYQGKLTCLLGPNGVGKSTLVKTIMGQLPSLGGEIWLQGMSLGKISTKELSKKIAVVLTDKVSLGNVTVYQMIALGRIPHTAWHGSMSIGDHQKVENAIEITKIGYLRHTVLSELSDGQLQKVMIARALAQDGELLILDEPTAHLDMINRFEVMHLLRRIAKEEQKAILVVTHDLDIAIDTADEFWIMQCSQPLVCGTPEDLIINGQINLLLPDAKLQFDLTSGKVQDASPFEFPAISGDETSVLWLKSIIRKNVARFLNLELELTIETSPFLLKAKDGDQIKYFHSFQQFIDFYAIR